MVKHETPEELDELWEREEITPGQYYSSFGLNREEFWELYWSYAEEGLNPLQLLGVFEENAE